jgi:class III poly(R)-hydroxyalkanoic acid synthase PhaE subunit
MADRNPPDQPLSGDWLNVWFKTAADFWAVIGKMGASTGPDSGRAERPVPTERFQEFWGSSTKLWDATAKAVSEPGFMELLQKGFQTTPEISMRLFQTAVEGFFELQKRWTDRIQKLSAPAEPYTFSDLDREFLNRWTDVYKKEFQQFLNIPQLGLTRSYQEKLNQSLDKYNLFQAAMTEFLHLLSVPLEKSSRVLQDKVAELVQNGKLPEDPKHYYHMWIKILEGHFMTLFQSQQYTETMAKTLDALNQFLAARNQVLEDAFKLLPVCTLRDMDEINREIYVLKKRIRELEKKVIAYESTQNTR